MSVDSGPTTVGSIVGKLRMDRSEWARDVAATKAEVRELEGLDPDIHIDDNAAAVTSRLAAAKAATDALGNSSEELGRKTRRTTDETIRANEANRTSVTRVGAIVTAVAMLVPLLAPVGAAAVGVGGAFMGMGAAGVLALFGIHREMEDGTAVGQAYRRGVDSLGASMSTLSRTAAVNVLNSFRRVVHETRDAMPGLNTQVGQFSTILGRSGANLFTGGINSLKILNPLLLTAGLYVQSLTEGFQRWTENGGLEEFGDYALSSLPMVTEVLGKLATMVMHILQALAPLGTIGLAVLSGVADVISNIPVEVLSQLIVTITWGAVAFKLWGFVAPMLANVAAAVGAVGAATTIATGPIGWAVAGLSALAGILAVVIARNHSASAATTAYTAAIEADTGAIGANTRAKAAQALVDNGALEAAKKLGVSVETVTSATIGQRDAIKDLSLYTRAADGDQEALNEVMKKSGMSYMETVGHLNTLVLGYRAEKVAISDSASELKLRTEAVEQSTYAARAQQQADEAVAAAIGISVNALQDARMGQEGVESSTAKATAELYLQGDAAGLLRQQLDLLNGKALSAAESQNRFESQLVGMTDAIKNNGTALEGMDAGAIANRGSILDLVQASQDAITAFRDQGASQDEVRAKYEEQKKAIEDQATALGLNRDEVRKLIDEVYKFPSTVPPIPIEVETAEANRKIAAFLAQVSQRVAWIQVRATMPDLNGDVSGSGRPGVAMGGTIPGLAGGGSGGTVFGPGTAGSDTAGLFRLARGEEVISNVFGQADRNRALLKQINAGYTPSAIRPLTVGNVPSRDQQQPIVKKEGDKIVNLYITGVQNEDPQVIAQIVGREVRRVMTGRP